MIFFILLISLLTIFLLNQGSLEELFVRHEVRFSTLRDKGSIIDWLSDSGKHAPKSAYRDSGRKLAEPFKIEDSVEVAPDIARLKALRKSARALSSELGRERITETIDTKIEVLTEEESITEQITEFRERVEDIKSLPIEEQKDLFRSGTREERDLAGVALGEVSPQRLGGLISGEKRRVAIGIRELF